MKRNKALPIMLVLALSLAIGGVAVGTLAWLSDSADPLENVFTTADINVELTETFNAKSEDGLEANDIWTAQLLPGYSYEKDPVVTVKANSVDCYLFVRFEKTNTTVTTQNGTFDYLVYTSELTQANGWTQGTGASGNGVPTDVWFRTVDTSATDVSWSLLRDDKVTVNAQLTKQLMPSAENTPKLTYTAYASQRYKNAETEFTPAEAWQNAPGT